MNIHARRNKRDPLRSKRDLLGSKRDLFVYIHEYTRKTNLFRVIVTIANFRAFAKTR
jgi:hypothetical protein